MWRWFDLPCGGVLELDAAATPAGLALELVVEVVDGHARVTWLLEDGRLLRAIAIGSA